MSLLLSWYLEDRIMLVVSKGKTSDQDMFDMDKLAIDFINRSNAPYVHVIIDNTVDKFTPSAKAITQIEFPKHPLLGWTILVGTTNPFDRFIFTVGSNFFKTRTKMTHNFDEALIFLNHIDSSLPPLNTHNLDKVGQTQY